MFVTSTTFFSNCKRERWRGRGRKRVKDGGLKLWTGFDFLTKLLGFGCFHISKFNSVQPNPNRNSTTFPQNRTLISISKNLSYSKKIVTEWQQIWAKEKKFPILDISKTKFGKFQNLTENAVREINYTHLKQVQNCINRRPPSKLKTKNNRTKLNSSEITLSISEIDLHSQNSKAKMLKFLSPHEIQDRHCWKTWSFDKMIAFSQSLRWLRKMGLYSTRSGYGVDFFVNC